MGEAAATEFGYPRRNAAASLKRRLASAAEQSCEALSAAKCRGLIEARAPTASLPPRPRLSAAKCRGLIEARAARCLARTMPRYPRRNAAASLKLGDRDKDHSGRERLSAAKCRGLIEAVRRVEAGRTLTELSAAKCRGLIEAVVESIALSSVPLGYPRRNAAASLKLKRLRGVRAVGKELSAAKCRGLIEAASAAHRWRHVLRLSAAKCRGLIGAA